MLVKEDTLAEDAPGQFLGLKVDHNNKQVPARAECGEAMTLKVPRPRVQIRRRGQLERLQISPLQFLTIQTYMVQ